MITLAMGAFTSCSDDAIPTSYAPTFDNTKNQASGIYRTGAILQGSININDNSKFDSCGILVSEYPDMTKAKPVTVSIGNTSASHSIIANVDGLKSGVTYYYCAYAKSGSTTVMGDINNFTTPSTSGPTIVNTRATVDDDQYTSCNVSSEVQDNGGTDLFLGGYIYKKVESDTDLPDFKFSDPDVMSISNEEAAAFDQTIPNLYPDTYYAVRAYGVSFGVGYGPVRVIKTPKNSLPAVSTTTVNEFTEDGMALSADIIDSGTSDVIESGFCYSLTEKNPTINDSQLDTYKNGNQLTAFLGDLRAGATYYVRAFAKNNSTEGIGYGEVLELKVTGVKVMVHDTAYVYPDLSNYMTEEEVFKAIDNGTSDIRKQLADVYNSVLSIKSCVCDEESMKSAIEAAKAAAEKAQSSADKAQSSANSAQNTADGAQSSADKAQNTANSALSDAKAALAWIGANKSDVEYISTLKEQIKELDDKHAADIAALYNELESKSGELSDSIANLRKLVAANEKTLTAMRDYYMKQFEKDSISISNLQAALSWIESRMEEQQKALETAQDDIAKLKEVTSQLSAKVASLEGDYGILSKKLDDNTSNLQSQINSLDSEIASVKSKVEKLDYRMTLLEQTVSQMKQSTPMPVIIDSCAIASVTDNALNVKAWIDYKKYADKYNEVFGKNALYGNDYYATLYPIVMAGFVFSTVSPEPTVQNCNKMIVVASPYTKDMTTITASIPLIANASTYYVRAFAINSYGTVYSPAEVFKVGPEGNDNQFPGFNARRIK